MLREGVFHAEWFEMTMSMLREKQFEACEKRLSARMGVSLFSPEATQQDTQTLFDGSYEGTYGVNTLFTLEQLRERVLRRLPLEAVYVSMSEKELLEQLLLNDGQLLLDDNVDIGAAEALVRRLWCGIQEEGEDWVLSLPEPLHAPIAKALHQPETDAVRKMLFRFDALVNGTLYLVGFLPTGQLLSILMQDVMQRTDEAALQIASWYIQSTFEYMTASNGRLVLLHPGLADPVDLYFDQAEDGFFAAELKQELLLEGMDGILSEEIPLHEMMCGALNGALRPDYDLNEAAEDLRILIKQGVGLKELEDVMASMLSVLPSERMKETLKQLYLHTPRWKGMRMALMQ